MGLDFQIFENRLGSSLRQDIIDPRATTPTSITAGQTMLNYHQFERVQKTPVRNALLRFSSPLSSVL